MNAGISCVSTAEAKIDRIILEEYRMIRKKTRMMLLVRKGQTAAGRQVEHDLQRPAATFSLGFWKSHFQRPLRRCWLPLALSGTLSLVAPDARALGVQSTVDATLAASVELRKRARERSVFYWAVREKQGHFLPGVTLSAGHTDSEQLIGSRDHRRADSLSIRLSQPLYRSQLWLDYREAHVNARSGEIRCGEIRDQLTLETLLAILEICRLRSRLAGNRHSLDFLERSLDIQRTMQVAGLATRLDTTAAEVETARYRDRQPYRTQFQPELYAGPGLFPGAQGRRGATGQTNRDRKDPSSAP
jgi:hypothetical protein